MTQMVGKYVQPHFDGKRISSFTAEAFDEWIAELSADEVPPAVHQLGSPEREYRS
jgi:hypothetical protein